MQRAIDASPSVHKPPRQSVRALIVEDEPTTRRMLRGWIEDLGDVEVSEAADGVEGLAVITDEGADLVVLDLNLPGLSGLDVLSVIRADAALCETPVLIVSAADSEQDIRRAVVIGVWDYLIKPLDPEWAMPRISRAIEEVRDGMLTECGPRWVRSRVLVGDPDERFCRFAKASLEGLLEVETAASPAGVVASAIRLKPDLVLFSQCWEESVRPMLNEKFREFQHNAHVALLVEANQGLVSVRTSAVAKSYNPKAFLAQAVRILSGRPASPNESPLGEESVEQVVSQAVSQFLGLTTGEEPNKVDNRDESEEFDLFGHITLVGRPGELGFSLVLRGSQRLADSLLEAIAPGESAEESDARWSAVREMLNIVSARLRAYCAQQGLRLALAVPEILESPPEPERRRLQTSAVRFSWRESAFELVCYVG